MPRRASGAPRAATPQPAWSQGDTALIPKSVLGIGAKQHWFLRHRAAVWGVVGAACAAFLTYVAVGARSPQQSPAASPAQGPAVSLAADRQPVGAASVRSVRIDSEPAGAELVSRGAVVGNTPAHVPVPEAEELYLIRMTGYRSQLVRVLPTHSGENGIRISLQPVGQRSVAAKPPAKAAPAAKPPAAAAPIEAPEPAATKSAATVE